MCAGTVDVIVHATTDKYNRHHPDPDSGTLVCGLWCLLQRAAVEIT